MISAEHVIMALQNIGLDPNGHVGSSSDRNEVEHSDIIQNIVKKFIWHASALHIIYIAPL